MSVDPTGFAANGDVQVSHTELGHTGTVPLAQVTYAKRADGTPAPDWLVLTCPEPGCGWASTHPAAGGSAPAAVQEMFFRKVRAAGGRTDRQVRQLVRNLVVAQEGPERIKPVLQEP